MQACSALLIVTSVLLCGAESDVPAPAPVEVAPGAEKPRYEIRFLPQGNERVSVREIHRALGALRVDLERTGVTGGGADDAAYEAERFYHRTGFEEARVTSSWRQEGDVFEIVLSIVEGHQSLLAEVVFIGNETFTAAELLPCFAWKRGGFFGFGAEIFTAAVLERGVSCVISKLQYDGFLFAEAAAEVTIDEAAGRHVSVRITEGNRVLLENAPTLVGAQALSESELEEALDLELPTVYTPRLPLLLRGRLVDRYRAQGHLLATVATERNVERNGKATLTFSIEEGPRTIVESVRIEGHRKTKESVLRRRITLHAGDLYNEERVRESTASLYRSGLFSHVTLKAVPVPGAEGKAYLDATVKEKSRYQISLLGGYGSYEFLRASAVLENINVFGWGHRLRVSGSKSFRSESAVAEYTNPFFLSERLSQEVRSSYSRREHPSFQRTEFGGQTGLSYRVTDHIRTSAAYRLRQSESEDVEDDVPPELIDDVLLSSVELSAVADFRNSALDPTRGWTGQVGLEYAADTIGSELDFLRPLGLLTLVIPLGDHVQLLGSARLGAIVPFGQTDEIPIQERFFLGGESSIRSFLEDEAGPFQNNDPIGGEAFTSYSAELRFPIFRDLRGALFFDTGTLTKHIQDFGGGRFFHAVGIGARYRTIVGPLRVDLALNPEREDDEKTYAIHFGLGYPF